MEKLKAIYNGISKKIESPIKYVTGIFLIAENAEVKTKLKDENEY